MLRQINYVPLSGGNVIPQLQDYSYDDLNRIGSVAEQQMNSGGGWAASCSQTFAYDRYGNKRITAATGGVNGYNPTYNTANNRINGLSYDAAGNITYDALTGGTMTYDAENRLLTASSGGGASYAYDGEGKRVKRATAGQEWWYVHGIGGELLAEYLSTGPMTVKKEYGYRNGQMLVVWDADKSGDERLKWLVTDHLGSTRMEADKSGSLAAMRRHDFLPFGEELNSSIGAQRSGIGYEPPASNVKQKFTGYERDSETGLDFAQARHFNNTQGRFTSSDPLLSSGKIQDPRTWNRYPYSLNSPLRLIDPTGLYVFDKTVDEEKRKKFRAALDQARKDLEAIKSKYGEKSDGYKKVKLALDAYGTEGDKNGVIVAHNDKQSSPGVTGTQEGRKTTIVSFTNDAFNSETFSGMVAHEGSHTANALDWIHSGFKNNPSAYQDEFDAHFSQALIGEINADKRVQTGKFSSSSGYFSTTTTPPIQFQFYNTGWEKADVATLRAKAINDFIAKPENEGGYNLTPASKKKAR